MSVGAPHSHLVLVLAYTYAFSMTIHYESIDALVPLFRMCVCNNHVYIGRISTGNPVFGSINHIMIAFIRGYGALFGSIRTGLGFRKQKCAQLIAAGKWLEEFFFLFLIAI